MHWIELTEYSSESMIRVNLVQASSIQRSRDGKFTTIWFSADPKNGIVKVKEEPQAIFEKIPFSWDPHTGHLKDQPSACG
jgi:hypothetical protein